MAEDKNKSTTTAKAQRENKAEESKAQREARAEETKEPTAQDDRAQLDASAEAYRDRGARAAKVEKDPAEAQQNHADWQEGRDPNDVVEVEGQRETVEARMARNGSASPEKAAGATTLR